MVRSAYPRFFTLSAAVSVDPMPWYVDTDVFTINMSDFIEFAAPGVPLSTPEAFQLEARLLSSDGSFNSKDGPSPSASSPSASVWFQGFVDG